MSERLHRWYVVRYQSKDDPSQGIDYDYDFGEQAQRAAFFPTEQAAYAIQSLMNPGVMFTLTGGRKQTIHDFQVEKIDEYKYAIYTEQDLPTHLMAQVHPFGKPDA